MISCGQCKEQLTNVRGCLQGVGLEELGHNVRTKNTNRSPYKGICLAILGVFGHAESETAGALELLGGFVCLWWSLGAQGSKLRH